MPHPLPGRGAAPRPLPATWATALLLAAGVAVATAAAASAQAAPTPAHPPAHDSGFAALQQRGKLAMGVDQYTSTHRFDALPDGGRIALQRDVDDAEGVATIRAHLREIVSAFAAGDFDTPRFVHAGSVPGAATMAAKRAAIRYEVRDLPRGAELRMTTRDPAALAAIHAFLAFQRGDHRAGGTAPTADTGRHAGRAGHGSHAGHPPPAGR
ncbi:MAG TPA: hypothetical protein VFS08_10835 [Gemmatimonadaceae bacterium]|nr:hypothetical protein [Gemmatimonadaceae bacterium]